MSDTPLYRRLLGERFDRLPAVLRRFHDDPKGGRGHGHFRVERGTGLLPGLAARLFRLPSAGSNVRVTLRVIVIDGCERWIRDVGGRRLESLQWMSGSALIEQLGPLRLAFDAAADESGLHLKSRRAWLFFVPLPRFAMPRVDATALAEDGGWRIHVRVMLPSGGLLLDYAGILIPEICHHSEDQTH